MSETIAPEIEEHRLEYARPFLYPKQSEAIFDPHRYSVIEASTKAGKTSGCIVWIIELALAGQDGWNWPAPPCWGPLVGHEPLKRSHGADPCDPSQVVLLCVGHNSWVEDYPVARKLLGL